MVDAATRELLRIALTESERRGKLMLGWGFTRRVDRRNLQFSASGARKCSCATIQVCIAFKSAATTRTHRKGLKPPIMRTPAATNQRRRSRRWVPLSVPLWMLLEERRRARPPSRLSRCGQRPQVLSTGFRPKLLPQPVVRPPHWMSLPGVRSLDNVD